MAPPRQRTTAIMDDSRSEASSGTREYSKATTNKRKTGANKDKAPVTSVPANRDVADEQPRVCTMQSFFGEQETKTTSVDSRPTSRGRKYLSQRKKNFHFALSNQSNIANLTLFLEFRSPGPISLSKSSTPIGMPINSPHQVPTQTITPESSCRRESACAHQPHSPLAVRSPSPPPIEINQITPLAMAHPAMTAHCTKSPDKTA